MKVPFNKEHLFGGEKEAVIAALESGHTHGDGKFTKLCHTKLKQIVGSSKVLMTTSCSMAFEMSFILCNIGSGDEVIMPSFGYPSAASALMVHGGIPKFVDVKLDTLCIDEDKIEAAITSKTKAIFVVHYAGVSCDMDKVMEIAQRHGIRVIEDAAQAIGSYYTGKEGLKHLGAIGDFGTISFHGTKNIISGEGGALFVNKFSDVSRSEIVWEKGTDRSSFLRGEVDKYSWVDLGSSYLPSEMQAALLSVQLEHVQDVVEVRKGIFEKYASACDSFASEWSVVFPKIPSYNRSNYHLYAMVFEDRRGVPGKSRAESFSSFMKGKEVSAYFHFVPLHMSKKGESLGYDANEFPVSAKIGSCLVRLPIYNSMTNEEQEYVIKCAREFFGTE